MARPRAFDIDEALDQAQAVFWARGYDATTTAELAAAMGIQKGSLFHAFGDKRSLFVRTLTRYLEGSLAELHAATADTEHPLQGIRDWVMARAQRFANQEQHMGCFGVNSSVGLCARDEELAAIMVGHWERIRSTIEVALARAQQLDQLRQDLDAVALSRLIMTQLAGMSVMARQGLATAGMPEVVQALFDSLHLVLPA
ncbi:MAG: TetR/AcrR family transcriptional regulator [Planctomycetota bacterium]